MTLDLSLFYMSLGPFTPKNNKQFLLELFWQLKDIYTLRIHFDTEIKSMTTKNKFYLISNVGLKTSLLLMDLKIVRKKLYV